MIFVPLPFLIALFMLPSIVILDITREQRKKFVLKVAAKYGIIDQVDVKFEVIQK